MKERGRACSEVGSEHDVDRVTKLCTAAVEVC